MSFIHTLKDDEDTELALDFDAENGRLFQMMRVKSYGDTVLSYDNMKPFLYFLDKYVSKMVGKRELDRFFKENKDKTMLDKLTMSDLAYAILLCENSKDSWDETEKIKRTCTTREEKKNYVRKAEPPYHVKRGVRIPLYGDGWRREGKGYYEELKVLFKGIINKPGFWKNLEGYWKEYAKENSRYHYETLYKAVAEEEEEIDEEMDEDDFALCLPGDQGYGGNASLGGMSHDINNEIQDSDTMTAAETMTGMNDA